MLQRVGRLADGFFPLTEAGDTAKSLIDSVKGYAKEAGRNPDDLKIEGRIELTGTPEEWKTALVQWEELGVDAISVGTARSPFHTPEANSWYVGANIPGKARALLAAPDSAPTMRAKREEVAANGYAGFLLE